MHRISHRNHITRIIPLELAEFFIKRFEQLAEETDVPPIIIQVKPGDDITGPDYAFIGNRGLLSDLYEEHGPREAGFIKRYEFVSFHPDLKLYELLFLQHCDGGYWILIPEAIVEAHADLKWVLTAEELGGLCQPHPV